MKIKKEVTVDFRGSMWECRPRMLWQALFDIYRENGGDLSNMDNILIDFRNCRKCFYKRLSHENDSHTFLWGFHRKFTTWINKRDWLDGNLEATMTIRSSFRSSNTYVLCEVTEYNATLQLLEVQE